MESSLFVLKRSQVDIDHIRAFCAQSLSEGKRLDYKKAMPGKEKLAKTICAFANTDGGIILVGVEADQKRNVPTNIPGIPLKDNLEETIVNICLSHISPTVTPEVKVCDFSSDPNSDESDRAVLFIRVAPSYAAPHYLSKDNEIPVRAYNRNARADLATIEALLDRRERASRSESWSTQCDYKSITTEDDVYECVVVVPHFPVGPLIPFNKSNISWLSKTANEVITLSTHRPGPYHLTLTSLNIEGQITRYCRIYNRDGHLVFQRPSVVIEGRLESLRPIVLLIKSLKSASKILSRFGFYGDLSVGLTINKTENLMLGFPEHRSSPERYRCEFEQIHISRTLSYDDLAHLEEIIESIFQDFCLYFGVSLEESIVAEIVKEIFSHIS